MTENYTVKADKYSALTDKYTATMWYNGATVHQIITDNSRQPKAALSSNLNQ